MSDTMFFSVAVFVFTMMLIGLGLTVWEFMRGQPRLQEVARTKELSRHRQSQHRRAA